MNRLYTLRNGRRVRANTERVSGLICGRDFKVEYSQERINPGIRTLFYEDKGKWFQTGRGDARNRGSGLCSVVTAGVHRALSHKVAEAVSHREHPA